MHKGRAAWNRWLFRELRVLMVQHDWSNGGRGWGTGSGEAERGRQGPDQEELWVPGWQCTAWEAVNGDPAPGLLTSWSFFIIVLDYVLRLLYEKEKKKSKTTLLFKLWNHQYQIIQGVTNLWERVETTDMNPVTQGLRAVRGAEDSNRALKTGSLRLPSHSSLHCCWTVPFLFVLFLLTLPPGWE